MKGNEAGWKQSALPFVASTTMNNNNLFVDMVGGDVCR